MWYIIQWLKYLLSKTGEYPKTIHKVLTLRYSYLQSKAMFFAFLFVVIFTGAFIYDLYLSESKYKTVEDKELIKQYLSKIAILTIFLILNFFMNKLHLFAYNVQGIYWHIPSNPIFWIFLFFIIVLLFGLLTLSSDLVPSEFHLHSKFDGNFGSSILLGLNAFYAFCNILQDESIISFLVFLVFAGTSLMMNEKVINNWILYGILTLLMINNMQFVNNMEVGNLWIILHYSMYALQLVLFMFGLIKSDYKFFESFKNIFQKSKPNKK